MTESYPWALPNPVVLFGVVVLGILGVVVLAWKGTRGILSRGRRSRPGGVARATALLTGAGALGVYVVSVLPLLYTDETRADQLCKAAVGPVRAAHVVAYEVTFVPLRFGCRVEGGESYEALVSGYVNPTVLGLVLGAAFLAVIARRQSTTGAAPTLPSAERPRS